MFKLASYAALIGVLIFPATIAVAEVSEASLRAADAEQMRIIVDSDAKAQQRFMHPNFIINGPSNKILRKDVLVTMLAEGRMGSEDFERTIEGLAITGNVGVVMGREVVRPTASSQLGTLHGGKVLNRRFTNVFLFEDGEWRFLARQATVVD